MASLLVLIKKIVIQLIRIYQISISPILGHRCRFEETCSQYGINVIHKFGIFKGSWKIFIRILRCHPLTINIKKKDYFLKHINIKDVLNMDSQRNFFIIAFLIMSFILWQTWESDHSKTSNVNLTNQSYNNHHNHNKTTFHNKQKNQYSDKQPNIITIKTDVFLLKINLYGGDIEEVSLMKYLEDLNSNTPFHLLCNSETFQYRTRSGLIHENSSNLDANQKTKLLYTVTNLNENNIYTMLEHENELILNLIHRSYQGISYIKRYIFHKNDYSIHVHHIINNMSTHAINTKLFGDLIQTIHPSSLHHKNSNEDSFPLYSYRGAAYSTDKKKYQKYSFKDIKRTDLNTYTTSGWIAMLQKYFVTAWLPLIPKNNTFYTKCIDEENIAIGFKSDSIHIPAKTTAELQSIIWIGPKLQEAMKLIAPNLDLVVDYGWLWFISQPLFQLLQFIYHYIGNWGISIILITLIIRLMMYPLTKAQYISMAKMRTLQPKIALIQEEYKHDKYQYHQKTIELYKTEKVNPLGGCLPLLIQMPIFLALYYMLSGSVDLRHAKFAFWINDLSSEDPYYVLPIIMGITMFYIQKLSPTTVTDPMQKKIMTIMLIIFTIFFLWFPSGLVLYYIVSNVITIIQQQIIYHGFFKNKLNHKQNTE